MTISKTGRVGGSGGLPDMHDCCHYHHARTNFCGAGPAIEYCYEDDYGMFAGNGEYESQVNYCPFCGEKADIQGPVEDN